ncbi:MAG: ADOP family duplicated permease [Gemmatimonadota bacterium]
MALYRVLLRLLPADFRAAYGEEMVRMLAARLAAASGPAARAGVRVRAVADVLHAAMAERLRPAPPSSSGRKRRPLAGFLADLRLDARYARRTLLRAPSFTLGAVLTLAVGIGTLTALFTVVDGVLLRPLPWPHAERLVMVNSPYLNPDNRAEWLEDLPLAEAAAAFTIESGTARTPKGAESVQILPVGEGFPDLVGARVRVGRGLMPGDHAPGAPPVALVREDFWRLWWGEAPAPGAVLEIDGLSYDVVGLLPADAGFFRYRDAVVWTPLENREIRGLSLLARLPAGTTVEDARPGLEALADRMATPERRAFVARIDASPVNAHGVAEAMLGSVRSTLWVLLGAGGVVLLLAVANVGSLWVGRGLGRRDELAVRAALGAGGGRLVRQLTVEAVLVAGAGAALGLALAALAPALLAVAPDYLPRAENITLGWRAGLFALGAALASALLFGVLPAWALARRAAMPARGRGATEGRGAGRVQGALVVAEVAAALVLVVGAGLLARTYDALRPEDPGFRVEDRLVASFNLSASAYPEPADRLRFTERLLAEVRARTGDAPAVVATDLPLTGMSSYMTVPRVDGEPLPEDGPSGVHFRAVTPGYFAFMEMPMLLGRGFSPGDGDGAPLVAVVNESAARVLWGEGVNPVGRELTLEVTEERGPLRVVGMVRDAWILRGPEPRAEVYASFPQLPSGRFHLVVATPPGAPVGPAIVRQAARAVDPGVPIRELAPLEQLVSWSVVVPRFQASVLGAVTAVALFLAAMGVFAVLSQMIGRRRRELGIRLALGATGSGIMMAVLRRAGTLALVGVAVGTGIAWGATRVLEAHLYGVTPHDPATFAGAALILVGTVLAAGFGPARRAGRVEPMRTLRDD